VKDIELLQPFFLVDVKKEKNDVNKRILKGWYNPFSLFNRTIWNSKDLIPDVDGLNAHW
jgi:hypothetical protein